MRLLVLLGLRLGFCLIILVCGNTDANTKVPVPKRDSTSPAQQVRNVIPRSQDLGFIYRKQAGALSLGLTQLCKEKKGMLSCKLIMAIQRVRWDHTSAKETF